MPRYHVCLIVVYYYYYYFLSLSVVGYYYYYYYFIIIFSSFICMCSMIDVIQPFGCHTVINDSLSLKSVCTA